MLIRGAVRSTSGERLRGAAVVFVEAPVDVPDIGALTGDDGSFVVGAPAPGRYRLGVTADGHLAGEIDVRVEDGADAVVEVSLIPDGPPAA